MLLTLRGATAMRIIQPGMSVLTDMDTEMYVLTPPDPEDGTFYVRYADGRTDLRHVNHVERIVGGETLSGGPIY